MPEGRRIYSIGHSTRTREDLIRILKHYAIGTLADLRHFPMSRHNPQFNRTELERELPAFGIRYLWLEKLGGFRQGGYLSYMNTAEFAAGIEALEEIAHASLTAYMCAELLWFKCHRRHVSDALAARGWEVIHIFDERRTAPHTLKFNTIKCD